MNKDKKQDMQGGGQQTSSNKDTEYRSNRESMTGGGVKQSSSNQRTSTNKDTENRLNRSSMTGEGDKSASDRQPNRGSK